MLEIGKLFVDSPQRGQELNSINEIMIATDEIRATELEVMPPEFNQMASKGEVTVRVVLSANDVKTGKPYFPRGAVHAHFKVEKRFGNYKIVSFSYSAPQVSHEDAVRGLIQKYYKSFSEKNEAGVVSILSQTLKPEDTARRRDSLQKTFAETGDITISQLDIDDVQVSGTTATAKVTVLIQAKDKKGRRYYPAQPMVLDWNLLNDGEEWKLVRYTIVNIKALRAEIRIRQLRGKVELDEKAKDHPVTEVDLRHSKVSDDDLALLADLPHLESLILSETTITDEGLAHFAGLTKLRHLYLFGTKITDDGLKHLKGLTNLIMIDAGGTGITDKGLEHLAGLKKLSFLNIPETKVTDSGFAKLKVAIPALVRMSKT
jgi:hypothetical protein